MSRIAFLGQKPIGTECFKILVNNFDLSEIKFVVTNSEKKGWWNDKKILEVASSYQIPCFSLETIDNSFLQNLVIQYEIEYLFSIQFNKIISVEVLKEIKENAFNLHLAPLPNYRGWHSASHSILNGDSTFGSTLHKINQSIDDGPIVGEEYFSYTNETAGQLYHKSEISGARIFKKFISDLKNGIQLDYREQVGASRRYHKLDLAKRLQDEDVYLERKVRAVDFQFRLDLLTSNDFKI